MGEEQRSYDLFGHVASCIDAGGAKMLFSRTVYGKPYHILHPEGSEERFEYSYDALGRHHKKREFFGSRLLGFLETVWTFDLLDRPLSESLSDSSGTLHKHVGYVYDEAGRLIETRTTTSSGIALEKTVYNSHGDPISFTDPLGNTTHTRTDYLDPSTEVTDPQGRVTISRRDEQDRLISLEQLNPFGRLVKKQEFTYNAVGDKTRQIETVFNGPAPLHQHIVQWDYNAIVNLYKKNTLVGKCCYG